MNKKNLSGKLLALGLMILVWLSSVSFAAQDKPFIPPTLIKTQSTALTDYANLLVKYDKNCESISENPKPSGSQLKSCLQIAKSLLEKFDGFTKSAASFESNLKGANKWTKELDADFEQNAVKRGMDEKFASFVKQNGGFRALFEKSAGMFEEAKADLNREVKELESKLSTTSFVENDDYETSSAIFIKASHKPAPGMKLSKYKCAIYFVGTLACSALGAAPCAVSTAASGIACLASLV